VRTVGLSLVALYSAALGLACSRAPSDDPTGADASSGETTAAGQTAGTSDATRDGSSEGASSEGTAGATESTADSAGESSTASEGASSTTLATDDSGGETSAGATGLEGFCERYFVCGGTTYDDVQDCIDESLGFWGSCPEMIAALDAFGDCMLAVPCRDYDPDAYYPPDFCPDEWQAVNDASC
jgi:hypothetical protein